MSEPIFRETDIPMLVLLCECNSYECAKQLPLDQESYRTFRETYPNGAAVLPGHQDPDDEIIHDNGDYLVVRD